MNRRGFFGAMAAAIAGATLDPERLLWEPGKKLISIPKPQVQMIEVHSRGYDPVSYSGFWRIEFIALEEFRRRYPAAARAYDDPEKYSVYNQGLFSGPPSRQFAFPGKVWPEIISPRTPES